MAPPAPAEERPSFRATVRADLARYGGEGWRGLAREFVRTPALRYTVLLRACQALRGVRPVYPLYALCVLWLLRVGRLYGISIPVGVRAGPGLYIGHYGTIVVHPLTRIGRNCNLHQGVTIGQTNRGARAGVPVIGDNVYIGPGAKVIGGITLGDGCAVGANAVVTRDVPADGVAVGVPARVISSAGSAAYIQHPVPPPPTSSAEVAAAVGALERSAPGG